MYALEYKQLYIPREALTKNRTCQSYRLKQYAVCEAGAAGADQSHEEKAGGVACRPAGR